MLFNLTLSFLQTNKVIYAKSVDLDQTALNELSHLDLHCLPFCFHLRQKPSVSAMVMSKMEEFNSETQVQCALSEKFNQLSLSTTCK